MSTDDEESKGICVLSFDSGGPGTYSQLLIMKEYMIRLANDLGIEEEEVYPVDYFDLMGGVGFGGLVSVMLGLLKMNVDDAIEALITVASAVFRGDSQDAVDPETNSRNLKNAIEEMIQIREVPVNTKMYERDRPQTRCKVVLYAAASGNINHPQAFRTYSARGSSLNPTIVEAICATMATQSYFLPVKIGPRLRQQSFIGGALGANNPTRELLKEASAIFGPNRRVAQVLSIGSGLPRVMSTESSTDDEGIYHLLKEIATDCEMVAQELSTRLYAIDAYLRLNVDRGMELVAMTDWNDLGLIETHTAAYIATATGMALDTSVRHLQERTGSLTLGQINLSSSIRVVAKTAPSVSPYFVLRIKEWEKLVWHLVTSPFLRQRILAITGMGGCGKTQIVSYFLQEYPSLFKHTAFVDASTLSSIKADLQAWARALGDGHERDEWEDAIRVLSSVPQHERWALILDNADDPTLNVVPFLPKSINLTVILTSRNRNLGNLSTTYHMELGAMELDEALATLLSAARRQLPLPAEELQSAHTLLNELGCLAVALVQAGTYCHELSCSFAKYLSLFYSHRAELMKRAESSPLDNYKRGVYTALDLSYKALPQDSRDFLHFISFFHHADIPLSALAAAAEKDFKDYRCRYLPRPGAHEGVITDLKKLLCVAGKWSEMQVQDTLHTLRSFSLLSITTLGDNVFLHLHPLIQAWARDMNQSISLLHQAMTLQVLTTCCGVDSFQLHRFLLPHIFDILEQLKGQDIHVNDLTAAGKLFQEQGHYQAAAELVEIALEIIANSPDNNEGDVTTISSLLATAYWHQGRHSEAEKVDMEVLEQRRRTLGMEHPATIEAAGNLASTYLDQGRWSEAEELQVEVLEQSTRVLGVDHLDTLLAAENLALTYGHQGRWSEAEKLQVGVLEQKRGILGMDHQSTILSASSLALTYRDQGRWSEAEELQVEALEQSRKFLGTEHPDTILLAANLAATYGDQGRYSEAEQMVVVVLEKRRRTLGMDHPDTIKATSYLAMSYRQQGRLSEAEKLQVEVLEQRRKILGMEHPDTISVAANLAVTYGEQGRWEECAALLVPTVQLSVKVRGTQHPATQRDIRKLVSVYETLGKEEEAQEARNLLIS